MNQYTIMGRRKHSISTKLLFPHSYSGDGKAGGQAAALVKQHVFLTCTGVTDKAENDIF